MYILILYFIILYFIFYIKVSLSHVPIQDIFTDITQKTDNSAFVCSIIYTSKQEKQRYCQDMISL